MSNSLKWSALNDIQLQCLADETTFAGDPVQGVPPVPFQFTLSVLGELYHAVTQTDFKPPKGSEAYAAAQRSPLRAVAYFSWNERDRIFLTRRVYPSHYGFISYSHVPQGWGALGLMIKEMQEAKGDTYRGYTSVRNIYSNDMLLPYLEEASRLNYRAVITVPVNWTMQERKDGVAGAIVFYLEAPEQLEGIEARTFRTVVSTLGSAMTRHMDAINASRGIPQELPALKFGEAFRIEIGFRCSERAKKNVEQLESLLLEGLNRSGHMYAKSHRIPRVAADEEAGLGESDSDFFIIGAVQHGARHTDIYDTIGHAVCLVAKDTGATVSWTIRHVLDRSISPQPTEGRTSAGDSP